MFDPEYNILSLRPHLTKTKQDQALQVMYMVKFGPTVLNFGFDFFLLVPFFGNIQIMQGNAETTAGTDGIPHICPYWYTTAFI